jgi:hypothetical protein
MLSASLNLGHLATDPKRALDTLFLCGFLCTRETLATIFAAPLGLAMRFFPGKRTTSLGSILRPSAERDLVRRGEAFSTSTEEIGSSITTQIT